VPARREPSRSVQHDQHYEHASQPQRQRSEQRIELQSDASSKGIQSTTGFLPLGHQCHGMRSVRKALRDGDLAKDTYGRVNCTDCEQTLKTKNDPDQIGTVRACPDCGGEWKEIR